MNKQENLKLVFCYDSMSLQDSIYHLFLLAMQEKYKKKFTKELLEWHEHVNERDLPWKKERDPYKIWLSEVILQQTRALQGLPYYLKFTEAYPTIKDLAGAKDDDVFRMWQGLGYYNRCRNMLFTARYITEELDGVFPNSYEKILNLKGVGTYTASAIASFAFGLPNAVVDGNVYRVLSRCYGIHTPFDTTEGKVEFSLLAGTLLDTTNSAAYNQAIMDLGATVCKPTGALCIECPVESICYARKNDMVAQLPVRSKKITVKKRYFNYLVIMFKDELLIHKRGGGDIWENLHEPYLVATPEVMQWEDIASTDVFKKLITGKYVVERMEKSTQRLTHQVIDATFYEIRLQQKDINCSEDFFWVEKKSLKNLAFPKTVLSFLKNNAYF